MKNKFLVIAVIGLSTLVVGSKANGLVSHNDAGLPGATKRAAVETGGMMSAASVGGTNGLFFFTRKPIAAHHHANALWQSEDVAQIMGLWNGGTLTSLQYASPLQPEFLAASGNGATGFVTRYPIEIVRSNATFIPAQMTAKIRENTAAGYINEDLIYETASYSSQLVGTLNGPDGVLGTADDVQIISGPLTQPVNRIRFAGASAAYLVNDAATLQQVREHMASKTPFEVSVEYIVRDNGVVIGSTKSVATTVPAPTEAPVLAATLFSDNMFQVSLVNGGSEYISVESTTELGSNAVWSFAGYVAVHAPLRTPATGGVKFFRAIQ